MSSFTTTPRKAVYKSKIREKKVIESTDYRPNLKYTWSEAILLYKNLVLQSRRDIQCAVLGKGPYTISNSYKDLVVTPVKWSAMSVEERGKHVAKLGISLTEETEEGKDREETPRQHELIGKFESSGLPDFLKGSWINANCIVELNGVGSFPNDNKKKIVISLTKPISHTVQISGKKLSCLECPCHKECGICAHTLAVVHNLGRLEDYVQSYRVPLTKMVASTVPSGTGKKDNKKKKICKREVKPP